MQAPADIDNFYCLWYVRLLHVCPEGPLPLKLKISTFIKSNTILFSGARANFGWSHAKYAYSFLRISYSVINLNTMRVT